MTATTNSGNSVTVLQLVLCLGIVVMLVGGWYLQFSLAELKEQKQEFQISLFKLKAQQQETAQIVQQLREKVRRQSKLIELRSQFEINYKVSS